jgi:non-canonical poly(A) RNA polymerase PAPD5/7
MPLSTKPPECTQLPFHTDCRLHKEVEDFSEWISPTSKEHDVRAYVVKRVVDAIESALPHCRAHPFGSFSTKLYGPDA